VICARATIRAIRRVTLVALGILVCTPGISSRQAAPYWLVPPGTPTAADNALAAAAKQLADETPLPALPVFARAVSDPLIGGYALLMRGRAELALKRTADAKASADTLLKSDPAGYLREAARVLAADVAEAGEDWPAVVKHLQAVAELKPLSPASLNLRLGRAAIKAGDRSVARGALNKVIYEAALSPEATDAAKELALIAEPGATPSRDMVPQEIARGDLLYGAKRFAEARKVFDAIRPVAAGRERDTIALRIAQSDLGLKKYAAARDALLPFTTSGDRQPEARYSMLGVLRGLARKDEYIAATRQLVADFSDSTWAEAALNDLATFYILEDEDEKAAAVFGEMYRRYPTGINAERAAWRAGWWAYLQKNYAETVRLFEDAFSRFGRSDYRSAWSYWTARAKESLGDRSSAATAYGQVVDLYKNSYYGREATRQLARLAPVAGAGVARVRRETPAPPPPPDVAPPGNARLIGRLLSAGFYDEAIGELKRVELESGPSPLVTATLAYAWNRKGELRTGITLMRRAYPKFLADGGEGLPLEIRRVIFPMAYWDLIQKYAVARGLDPHLMAALITQESTFDADVVSHANAWGLMQILPSTGRSYAAKLGIKPWRVSKLTNPEINIRIGMAYFADMTARYDGVVGALVAYNAGGSRYRKWVTEYPGADRDEFIDNIPFFETQNYLKRVLGTADDFRALYPLTPPARR
jgi:soluble lytic murein transglycosylase